MKRLALVLALAAALAGCGGAGVTAGQVSQKQFSPAHDWDETVLIPVYGYRTVCTTGYNGVESCMPQSYVMSWFPQVQHEHRDDTWRVKLVKDKHSSWVKVSHASYDILRVGDYFDSKALEAD